MARKRTYQVLTLVKCGETRWRREGRLQGRADIPLGDAGRSAAGDDAQRLARQVGRRGPGTIHHAPDEAATETAQAYADATSARTKESDDLADPSLGLLEGLLEQDVEQRYPKRYKQWLEDPIALIPPEGEPITDARARIFRAVGKIMRKSRSDEVTIVLHAIGFALLRLWLADEPAANFNGRYRDGVRCERYLVTSAVLEALREMAETEAVAK